MLKYMTVETLLMDFFGTCHVEMSDYLRKVHVFLDVI